MVEGRPVLPLEDVHLWAAKFALCSEAEPLVSVKELPSYDDLNFHIRTARDEEYVLKAHNGAIAAGSAQRLLAQNRFISRLRDAGLPVPAVVSTKEGVASLPMAAPGVPEANQAAHVRILTYLPGQIIPNEEPKSDAFLQAVGRLCGQLTKALRGFEDEGAVWDWDWHMKNVASACEARVSYVADPERRALARRLIESYRSAFTAEVMAQLPHSVIHSDLNDTNLLFEGDEVVGILDFGDSIYSCTVFDLGVAAGYYALAQADPMRVFSEVLRGYLREAELSDSELGVLYHAAYGRVLLSVCFSAQSCAAEPDNEYLAHTSEPGWAVLSKLKDVTPAAALERFRAVQAEVSSEKRGKPAAESQPKRQKLAGADPNETQT